jgi:hypothetical protein
MSAQWKLCRCGSRMKVTNSYDYQSRLECLKCGVVRHIEHVKVTEVVRLSFKVKNSGSLHIAQLKH